MGTVVGGSYIMCARGDRLSVVGGRRKFVGKGTMANVSNNYHNCSLVINTEVYMPGERYLTAGANLLSETIISRLMGAYMHHCAWMRKTNHMAIVLLFKEMVKRQVGNSFIIKLSNRFISRVMWPCIICYTFALCIGTSIYVMLTAVGN